MSLSQRQSCIRGTSPPRNGTVIRAYVVCNVAAVGKLCNKEKTSSLIAFQGRQRFSGFLRRHQGFPASAGCFCDSFVNNAAANVARRSSSETSREEPQATGGTTPSSVLLLPPPASSCHRIAVQIRSRHGSRRPDGDGQAASDLFIKR